jgi:serine protease AprX
MRVPKDEDATQIRWRCVYLTSSFDLDYCYDPVPVNPPAELAEEMEAAGEKVVLVRAKVFEAEMSELEGRRGIIKVWKDTPIAPFAHSMQERQMVQVIPGVTSETSPVQPCDCEPGKAKGNIEEIACYLGVDQIWASGHKGQGIVIGTVDGGINEKSRVIDGWPTDWGTKAYWQDHGNIVATDALGMAPEVRLYDIRISSASGGDTIFAAINGFHWAITRHKMDGTPHILSNSWGIYQEAWDPTYARNVGHPFTRKVVEALAEGILVLFVAGNCGGTCPYQRCGPDTGPGKSIWGANGHPDVITVGAVNINEQFIGYSSQGPAALDPKKPDFCSISHFQGYFASDSGTSAACPIAAGVVALLKQANPLLTQDQAKKALIETAKDIGPAGWDEHSGFGIIQARAAYDRVV